MQFSRLIQPLLLVFVLLFAQQAGAVHALQHALAEQQGQDQPLGHSAACEQCANFAQLGGALGGTPPAFALLALSFALFAAATFVFRTTRLGRALARGPPVTL